MILELSEYSIFEACGKKTPHGLSIEPQCIYIYIYIYIYMRDIDRQADRHTEVNRIMLTQKYRFINYHVEKN